MLNGYKVHSLRVSEFEIITRPALKLYFLNTIQHPNPACLNKALKFLLYSLPFPGCLLSLLPTMLLSGGGGSISCGH